MRTRAVVVVSLAFLLFTTMLSSAADRQKRPGVLTCSNGESLTAGGDGTLNVQVVGPGTCFVNAGTYYYNNINVYSGGTLQFQDDGNTDLWAANILIENSSAMPAGTPSAGRAPSRASEFH